jgi:hypothetical protein
LIVLLDGFVVWICDLDDGYVVWICGLDGWVSGCWMVLLHGFVGWISGARVLLMHGLDTFVVLLDVFLDVEWFCWMDFWRSDAMDGFLNV